MVKQFYFIILVFQLFNGDVDIYQTLSCTSIWLCTIIIQKFLQKKKKKKILKNLLKKKKKKRY